MMVTLLVYAYSVGVRSSRKIVAACERNLAFRAIVGDDRPDFRTISDFRKIHRAAMKPLFIEVLRIAGELGMVKLGNLSTDGTKMRANASRHKAMSYGYMNKELARLEAEVEQLLKEAEQVDAEQDAAQGSRCGDELPDELRRRDERLAKIRAAKARLEAEAQAEAQAEQRRRDEAQAQREAEGRRRRGKEPAPIDPTPEDKAQTPRPEEIMKDRATRIRLFIITLKRWWIARTDHRGSGGDPATAATAGGPMARAALDNPGAAGIRRPKGPTVPR
jgi:hypothetical protein